jgi:hypothetical protein
MDLNLITGRKKLVELGYYTMVTEVPVSELIDFDYRPILSPPPANDSIITKKETIMVAEATKKYRSKKDLEFIHRMDEDMDSFFIELLKKHNLKYPQRYIDLFYELVEPVLMNTKNYWNRPRPIQIADFYDIEMDPIVTDTIHTASYPSGHTFYSQLVANILSKVYPQLSLQFDNIAKDTGVARVQQGVHFPSDNVASIVLANTMYSRMQPKLERFF